MMIRTMQPCDIEEVAQIEMEVFSDPWSKQSFMHEIQIPNHIYLVAIEDDRISGYCGLWEVAGEGQITNVCVAPNDRGKKVATQMLQELLERAKQRSIKATTLEVRLSNEIARKLYRSLGFEEAGIRKNFYSHPTEDAMIMWRYD